MLTRYAVALFVLTIASAGVPASADDAAKPEAVDRLFLWEVTSDTNTVHLLGSIHVAKPDFYPLPAEMTEALEKSAALVVEVDISKLDVAALQKFMQEKGTYPPGDGLSKHVKKQTMDSFRRWCKDNDIPPAALEQFRPWALAVTITTLQMQKVGFRADLGVDQHLLNLANEAKKPVLELESMLSQLELLSGFPDDQQEAFLASTVDEADEMTETLNRMADAWKRGDAEALAKEIYEPLKEHPEAKPVMEKLFDERNAAMAEKVEAYLKEKDKPHLVVAGAGHMVGDKGIVALLKAKGYKVEQVTRAAEPAAAE